MSIISQFPYTSTQCIVHMLLLKSKNNKDLCGFFCFCRRPFFIYIWRAFISIARRFMFRTFKCRSIRGEMWRHVRDRYKEREINDSRNLIQSEETETSLGIEFTPRYSSTSRQNCHLVILFKDLKTCPSYSGSKQQTSLDVFGSIYLCIKKQVNINMPHMFKLD